MTPPHLPELRWLPTPNQASRHGSHISRVVVHRWGVRYASPKQEAASYQGVCDFFLEPGNQVSAHFVYPGSAAFDRCTQMVAKRDSAWAEAAYNATSIEVESADAIWLGQDGPGMHQLSRIVAFLLHENNLPAVWSHERGFCRHADLGAAGGGHTSCPTTNLGLWRTFSMMVQQEAHRGHFRPVWGR